MIPRRTKIVCTIGPASDSEEMLAKLMSAGMNVARVNFSHGTHQYHRAVIRRIKQVRRRPGWANVNACLPGRGESFARW